MIFVTDKRPDLPIYIPALRRTLRFEGGRYETDDPAEVKALRRNRYVTDFTETVEELSSPSPLDPPDKLTLSRDELDELARQAGVEAPERLPNKDAVVDAIEAAE